MDEPMCTKSSTDKELPKTFMPYIDTDEPILEKYLNEIDDPTVM